MLSDIGCQQSLMLDFVYCNYKWILDVTNVFFGTIINWQNFYGLSCLSIPMKVKFPAKVLNNYCLLLIWSTFNCYHTLDSHTDSKLETHWCFLPCEY